MRALLAQDPHLDPAQALLALLLCLVGAVCVAMCASRRCRRAQ